MAKTRLILNYPIRSYEQITVTDTAAGVTAGNIKRGGILITVDQGTLRWRADGTDPTESVGHMLFEGGELRMTGTTPVTNLKMIRVGAEPCIISVSHIG